MYAVLFLPDFPLQAALRGLAEQWDKPVALVETIRATARVVAVTPAARAEGVTPGLTPTQAQARCREVLIQVRSPARDAAAQAAVLQCADAFSPALEATATGIWTLDLRALATWREADGAGRQRWAESLRTALAGLDLRAHIGVGATPNLARLAAATERGVCVVDDAASWVAALPVAALEPPEDVRAILVSWGIRTVGELQTLGLAAVADRLGLEALSLFAAADVSAHRPLKLVRPVPEFLEAHDFDEPVTMLEPLLFLLRRFLEQLTRRLEPTGGVVREMTLRLRLESGPVWVRDLQVPEPTRDAEALFRMWHTRLENLRTEAAITGLTLTVQAGRATTRQGSLFHVGVRDPGQLQETLGRLVALLGADRVGTPVRVAGHQRDAFRLVPPDLDSPPGQESGGADPALAQAEWMSPVPWRRLRPAAPAQVELELEQGQAREATGPRQVRSPALNGRLVLKRGPWRASGRWWDAGGWAREDWDVQASTGATARLSRSGSGWTVTDLGD